MTSVGSFYAQRDNRLINVALTGYITDNGGDSGSVDLYHAAVAALDVTNSKLFTFDTRNLDLRASGDYYLVGITFPNILPPQYYPGFEVNIIINVKDTNIPSPYPLIFRIQRDPGCST
jgi:hypothetical protein